MFLAIAVDNLASAQELTAAEEIRAEEDNERQMQELEKELGELQGDESKRGGEDLLSQGGKKAKHDKKSEEEEEIIGPKPMLPYSALFILSPTNP